MHRGQINLHRLISAENFGAHTDYYTLSLSGFSKMPHKKRCHKGGSKEAKEVSLFLLQRCGHSLWCVCVYEKMLVTFLKIENKHTCAITVYYIRCDCTGITGANVMCISATCSLCCCQGWRSNQLHGLTLFRLQVNQFISCRNQYPVRC